MVSLFFILFFSLLSYLSTSPEEQSQEYRILAGYRESGRDIPLDRVAALLTPINQSIEERRRLFIDIGSGEGQILQYFAQHLHCECLGIESDPKCHQIALQRVRGNDELEKLTVLFEGDAEQFDYRKYCVQYDEVIVYMFLSSFGYSVMGRNLLAQLPIGSRVVSAVSPIGDYWKPLCVWLGDAHDLTLYLHVVTEEAQRSALSSRPSIQESIWRHPPPGSYSPLPIPAVVRTISHDTSPTEVIQICKESHHQSCHLSQPSASKGEGENGTQINTSTALSPPSTTTAATILSPFRSPPPPPPLPPFLPGLLRPK
jgi:SAM-dependent methyltransferase